ncbi:alpha/beta fold hydrolase [Planctomonas deserti]|uniref:alpha/beta fold hydrolase n=1 Tax=Planctomonas deserti TaxID=2144185 RepID=UPI000D3AE526|nr:alpha/beta hydrolase [Planctomonas deserti]
MVETRDVRTPDGRVVRAHDSGDPGFGVHESGDPGVGSGNPGGDGRLTIIWHHGSPQTGALLAPLLAWTAERRIRLVSYGRPSYGGSTPRPGRSVATAAEDVAAVADALGLERFAVMGASGGGPHALACAALLPDRVSGVVNLAGLAPFDADGIDWFGGMASDGASLRAAAEGRDARERYEATAEFDPESFVERDYDALAGAWSSLSDDVGLAAADGSDGLIDDDVAFVTPWGFDVTDVRAPVLLVHGGRDRVVPPSHSEWLATHCPRAELWRRPDDGHVSVLSECPAALDWLLTNAT